ncbi:YIPF5 [Branchiostoma lanceolatum]|uniref:YIPF5 protein n=1 Tax=Branchiostoma lanceolatum TaxID=7740 RepID=A0A8K0EYK2_BRALA|nr:YIPF5 [Branchiostoma lanceolatum]
MSGGYGQTADGFDQGFFQTNYTGYDDQNQNAGYDGGGQQHQYPAGGYDYSQQQGGYPAQPNIFTPDTSSSYAGYTQTDGASPMGPGDPNSFEDEPPLLEELGINFDHITQKTMTVLNPTKETDASILGDGDLAGPLVFCLMFGSCLLLGGKVQFGYIYGIGGIGCVSLWCLLNMMSLTGVSVWTVASILGYCLLPMVFLSGTSIILSLQGVLGQILATLSVGWCSMSASKLFVSALAMHDQQLLVAYPCALLYGVFALLTIF